MISITCVIPVYNVENYILDCLSSISRQTYKGTVECLLIDDCGSDNSIKIAQDFIGCYQGPFSFKIIKHEFNKGLSGARNTGLMNASCEYVYFLDSDDKIADDCFELLSKPLSTDLYDIVVGGFDVEPKQKYHTYLNVDDSTVLYRNDILKQYGSFNIYMMAWNKLCRKSFLLNGECFFYEGILHEDELWSFNIVACAKSMYVVNRPTYIYSIREGSIMTSSKQQKRIDDMTIVCHEVVKTAKKNNILHNYYVNRCIQNILSKPIKLCSDKSTAKKLYSDLLSEVGLPRYQCLIANGLKIGSQIRDFHWLLPYAIGFRLYCKLNRLKFD